MVNNLFTYNLIPYSVIKLSLQIKYSRYFLFLYSLLLFFFLTASAQKKYKYEGQFNFGCNLFLNYSKAQRFPGVRVFTAFGAAVHRGDFMVNYGPSLAIYSKSVGANLNPLMSDWQIDFTNSITAGVLWGKPLTYTKYLRTLHTGDFYNLVHRRSGAALLSTNFIFNNKKRHQIVGSLNATLGNFSINYYNDGTPFQWLGLSDGFDRYWTGGGGFMLHNKEGYNTAELSFDQFTGYVPLLYEVSGLLGINVPLYDNEQDKNTRYNFNTSAYQLRVNAGKNFSFHVGAIGSLEYNEKYWGVQDIIHLKLKYPFHPNRDGNRTFVGAGYNNFSNVQL